MAENDSEQLAPCPFCGGKAVIARDSFNINYHVYCTFCKAQTRTETACSYCELDECKKLSTGCINAKNKAQELAVLAWQKRHGERPERENQQPHS